MTMNYDALSQLIEHDKWEEFKNILSAENINALGEYGQSILFYIVREGGFRWQLFEYALTIPDIDLTIKTTHDEILPVPGKDASPLDHYMYKHSFQIYKKDETIFDYARRLKLDAWIAKLEQYQLEKNVLANYIEHKNIKL